MSADAITSDNEQLLSGLQWDHTAPKPHTFPARRVGREMSIREYCDFINSFPSDPNDIPRVVEYPRPFTFAD